MPDKFQIGDKIGDRPQKGTSPNGAKMRRIETRRLNKISAWGEAKRNPRGQTKVDGALQERQMSRAGFHFQSRLRRSFRAWPHGGADSLGFRFATPQAAIRRAFGA